MSRSFVHRYLSGKDGKVAVDRRRSAPWATALLAVALTACGSEGDGKAGDVASAASSAQSAADTRPGAAEETNSGSGAERWYTSEHVARGAGVYAENCASCHGEGGEGSFTWRRRGEDGKFPPPPLNGTAHTWHHPFRVLGSQIKFGAPGGAGNMPGFAEKLTDEDIVAVIAWFQSQWPDDIYAAWLDIELRSRSSAK